MYRPAARRGAREGADEGAQGGERGAGDTPHLSVHNGGKRKRQQDSGAHCERSGRAGGAVQDVS